MKKILLILAFILSLTTYGEEVNFNYDQTYDKALKLVAKKEYREAEKIYVELLKIEKRRDVYISYFNSIAWSGEMLRAAEKTAEYIAENKLDKDYELCEMEARFLFWGKEYEKAYSKYLQMRNQGMKLDKTGEDFIVWYENYQKFLIKFGYSYESTKKGDETHPLIMISFDWYKKYAIALSLENVYVGQDVINKIGLIELYKDNFYLFYGQGDIAKMFFGIDATFGMVTLGYKWSKYSEIIKTYKIQIDNSFGEFTLASKVNFNQEGNTITKDYMSQIGYSIFKYAQYYNLEKENKGVLTIKKEGNFGFLDIEAGVTREFCKDENGCVFSVGYHF